MNPKTLALGNEAIAQGLLENGCAIATACPGTPASETLSRLARGVAPRAVNLILLGFALAAGAAGSEKPLFCGVADIQSVLQKRLDARPQLLKNALAALAAGAAAPAAK